MWYRLCIPKPWADGGPYKMALGNDRHSLHDGSPEVSAGAIMDVSSCWLNVVAANGYSRDLRIVVFSAVHDISGVRVPLPIYRPHVVAFSLMVANCFRWFPSGAKNTPSISCATSQGRYFMDCSSPVLSLTFKSN